jgi:hypothetical protein
VGENLEKREKRTEKGSPFLSHICLPKIVIPEKVTKEYKRISTERLFGLDAPGYAFSIHAKHKNIASAGQASHCFFQVKIGLFELPNILSIQPNITSQGFNINQTFPSRATA